MQLGELCSSCIVCTIPYGKYGKRFAHHNILIAHRSVATLIDRNKPRVRFCLSNLG